MDKGAKKNLLPQKVIPLGQLTPGQESIIVKMDASNPSTSILREMGFIPGQKITMIKIAPLGDPCELRILGYKICVRKSELVDIYVQTTN